jgi:uncharacterized protein
MEFLFYTFVIVAVCLLVFMYKEAYRNKVQTHHLTFSEFPQSFGELKLFFISDIHKRKISDDIIQDTKAKGKVDLVIIGGDLLEKGVDFQRVKHNLALLRQLGPLYFVWGNNDYEVDYHELDALLLDHGVKILDNTAVSFESETGEVMVLLGVDDLQLKRDRLDLALQDAKQEGFRILVSHNPKITEKIQVQDRISLVLSGHTHGGQIRIFGFGPYELGGYRRLKNTSLFVSNGYGTTAVPLRLGTRAETHFISISNKSEV